jgi:hypothetical protein
MARLDNKQSGRSDQRDNAASKKAEAGDAARKNSRETKAATAVSHAQDLILQDALAGIQEALSSIPDVDVTKPADRKKALTTIGQIASLAEAALVAYS